MSTRFLVTLPNGLPEDVGADRVEFTPTHVVFTDSYGVPQVAYRADRVVLLERQEEG